MSFLYPFAPSSRPHSSNSHRSSRSNDSRSHRHKHKHKRSSSRSSHTSSRAPSIFSLGPSANRSTISSTSGHSSHSKHGSRSALGGYRMGSPSIFSSYSSSSSRRAKPRGGFIARVVHRIKRLFRSIMHYAKKHPIKVFFMVIVPLISGGILQKLLGVLGVRLPRALQFGKGSARGFGDGDGNGIGDSLSGVMSLAKMFL